MNQEYRPRLVDPKIEQYLSVMAERPVGIAFVYSRLNETVNASPAISQLFPQSRSLNARS